MNRSRYAGIIQRVLVLVAALFGLITMVAGTRVLAGAAPGYVVFLPLLIYNTVMGFFLCGGGVWLVLFLGLAWLNRRNPKG